MSILSKSFFVMGVLLSVVGLIGCGSNEPATGAEGRLGQQGSGLGNGTISPVSVTVTCVGSIPTVSFENDIQPIFNARCITCHNPTLFRAGQDLTDGNAYVNIVNHPTSANCSAQVPNSVRVAPCDPMGSMLWRKTKPDDSRCGKPMPLGSDGLGVIAPDEFAKIEAWIAEGAPNN